MLGFEGLWPRTIFQGVPWLRHRLRIGGGHGGRTPWGANVYGISMPSMYSSDGSKDDAADLAKNIGAHYDIQPIEPLFVSFQKQLDLEGVAAENLQARIRGVIVMAYSNSGSSGCRHRQQVRARLRFIPRFTAMRSADTLRSRICSRPVSGRSAVGVTRRGRRRRHWRPKIVGNEDGNTGIPLKDGVMIPVASIEKAPRPSCAPGRRPDSLPEYALLDKVSPHTLSTRTAAPTC